MPDCLFCRIVAGELPAEVIATSERAIAFMDINPATRGHALVVPRAHATDVGDIGEEDLAACAALAARVAAAARDDLGAAGVNLLNSSGPAAWQTVFHFHLHVIPRYAGDPLRLPWTPAPGDPAEIAAAAASYRAAASSMSGAAPASPPGVE
jgi:histidine triad (HIT) family protein